MAEPEFTATGVRIGKRLRSLTRAGQVGQARRHGSIRAEGRQVDAVHQVAFEAVSGAAPQERVGGRLVLRRRAELLRALPGGPSIQEVRHSAQSCS